MKRNSFLAIVFAFAAVPLLADDHVASFSTMIIRKYDKNDDRKLNADEYPDLYRNYFGTTDANRDGYVDAEELTAEMEKARRQWREKTRQRAEQQRARKVQEFVDRAFSRDANADGKLNADEASARIKKPFGEVDKDSDGYLSREEVAEAFGLEAGASRDIVETAVAAGTFRTLLRAAKEAGLADALQADGPITVFAPSDDAFAKIPHEDLTALLKDKEQLAAVLKFHVVAGNVLAKDVVELTSAKTLQGTAVEVTAGNCGVRVGGAKVTKADIRCSNGVIHVIDTVLFPPTQDQSADIAASTPRQSDSLESIVQTAAKSESFSTLVTAIKAAGLVESLSGNSSLTVFAPTDEAFSKIPEATLQAIFADKEKLTAILSYHIVPGKYSAEDVVQIDWAKTLQGQAVDVTATKQGVKVNGANVIQTDILCSNGVMHAIDSVILPDVATSASADSLLPFRSDDFNKTWVTVNDGVMGGVSDGNVRLTKDNTLEFYGKLSLRNNGGFASVRSLPRELDVESGDVLVVRVRGDGRDYFLNLYEPSYNMAFSYRAPFKTIEGEWTEIRVPLDDFYATSFGRRVRARDLDPAKVNSIGFLLSDKQAGPFRLEVESIRVE